MKHLKLIIAAIVVMFAASSINAKDAEVVMGAARTETYVPLLKGKRIAILSNMTGMVGNKHTLDIMLENGLNVTTIFSPEHGFRGKADAGEKVKSSIDEKTGIPIASLYEGKTNRPSKETMDKFDVIVVDIQDVGLRFYTYYITMINLMEASAMHNKQFVVLDRPNPTGMVVDGPMLNMKYRSGVGRLPIPAVHGLTMGEIALMANGEGWLNDNLKVKDLVIIKCLNYTHQTRYRLPIAPSPNLPNMTSVYLYASTCLFEGTVASLGRGTKKPFQVYGHPDMKGKGYKYSFIPKSVPGAKNPPLLNQKCYGKDLSKLSDEQIIAEGMNLEYVIDAYNGCGLGEKFFTSFFEKLTGDINVRKMIMEGKSAAEIKATWQPALEQYKELRRKYLIYAE